MTREKNVMNEGGPAVFRSPFQKVKACKAWFSNWTKSI